MIELTEEQVRALDHEKQPAAALDPRTGQEYRLIKQEVYEVACLAIKSQAWGRDDDEDLIAYEKFRKKP